jgi:hypothetical protein
MSAWWAFPLLLVGRDATETWHGSDDEYREVGQCLRILPPIWPYKALWVEVKPRQAESWILGHQYATLDRTGFSAVSGVVIIHDRGNFVGITCDFTDLTLKQGEWLAIADGL